VVFPLTRRWGLPATVILAAALLPAGAQARVTRAGVSIFAPVLIYHHVKLLKPTDDAIERGLTVLPAQFDAQLDYLQTHRYSTVTATALTAHLLKAAKLPPNPVVLTFDDGYTDVYADVYRQLRRRHMVATFFIVPGFLNTPRYLTWRQVTDMAQHGMDIEAHSMTHPDLTTLRPEAVRQEVARSRQVLAAHLHRPIEVFAYPYGAYNAAVLRAVSRAGFQAAFTTHQGWVARSDQLLTLPRVYIDIDDTPAVFAGRLRADPAVLAHDPT